MKTYTVYTREGHYYAEYTRLSDAQIAAKRIGGHWQRTE